MKKFMDADFLLENEVAKKLYKSLGFEVVYSYWYRIKEDSLLAKI